MLLEWVKCFKCSGTGKKSFKWGKRKGEVVPCTICKGKGGWWVPFGSSFGMFSVVIVIIIYLFIKYVI